MTALLSAGLSFSSAQANRLIEYFPAGALATLELHQADAAIDRTGRLLSSVLSSFDEPDKQDGLANMFGAMAKEAVGEEAILGVFNVAGSPHFLASSKLTNKEMFNMLFPELDTPSHKYKTYRVNDYSFIRDEDNIYFGVKNDVFYISSNRYLLESYLNRLSGKKAPKLTKSVAYSRTMKHTKNEEFSMFLDFSATSKMLKGLLDDIYLPRLLSPITEGLDTLGQMAFGMSSTEEGMETVSAHQPKWYGKDKALYQILTHTTDFEVQNIIPSDVESVRAFVCDPQINAYVGNWVSRFDLFDPTGFLMDSQLVNHMNKSSSYLGDECAQVMLNGGNTAAFTTIKPEEAFKHSVTLYKVADMEKAKKHMPLYAASFNKSIQQLNSSLQNNFSGILGSKLRGEIKKFDDIADIEIIQDLFGIFKMHYAFKGDYLIIANGPEAIEKVLKADNFLSDDSQFREENLKTEGVGGWSYERDFEDITTEQLDVFIEEMISEENKDSSEEDIVQISNVMETIAEIINRYDGLTSERTVKRGLILEKTNIRFRW